MRGNTLLCGFGIAVGAIATALGGWDYALQTLIIFMAIDYITGFIVAAFFQKSKKSRSGALESAAGFKGLVRKGMILLIVLIAHRIDNLRGIDFVRYSVIIMFIANEAISIVENAELMGIPVHKLTALKRAIGILNDKEGRDDDNTATKS